MCGRISGIYIRRESQAVPPQCQFPTHDLRSVRYGGWFCVVNLDSITTAATALLSLGVLIYIGQGRTFALDRGRKFLF